MSPCVFVGPTIRAAEAATVLNGIYLPPVRHGDVYRTVSLLRPTAIGIIDGYFQWSPAVWHKEILWAIRNGIHVFGSASMGALRAAELAPFGMHGVGRIFESYRDGVLVGSGDEPFEDDDEVALVHGPAESGYLPASEAMVNIRCTLADAVRERVIGTATRACLIAIAKSTFFPERRYQSLLERGRSEGLPQEELAALERWLASGQVDQKRADAVAMLEVMRDFVNGNPVPARADFAFERTTLWERAVTAMQPAAVHDPIGAAVIDELRLDVSQWEVLRQEVFRSLMGTVDTEDDVIPTSRDNSATGGESGLCIERAAWREGERRLRAQIPITLVERKMLALVRETDRFDRLRTRAERKHACLAALPQLPSIDDFSELQLLELRDWFFSNVVGGDMPDDLDQWIRDSGHTDLTQFHKAIFAEYVYQAEECGTERARDESSGFGYRRRSGG